jgi:hypothetical protein
MTTLPAFTVPDTLIGIIVLIVALVIIWAVVSIPVYVAGKLVTDGKSDFGDAMGATLGGAIAYVLVFWGGTFLLSFLVTPALAIVISFVLALAIWVAVYSAAFDTSWLGGLAIAIVGWAVLVVIDIVLVSVFGIGIPKFYPF